MSENVLNICFGDSEFGLLKFYFSNLKEENAYDIFFKPYISRLKQQTLDCITSGVDEFEGTYIGYISLEMGKIDDENFDAERKKLLDLYFYNWFKQSKVDRLYKEEKAKIDDIVNKAKQGYTLVVWQSMAPYSACAYMYLLYKLNGVDCKIISVGLRERFVDHKGHFCEPLSWGAVNIYDIALAVDEAKELNEADRTAIVEQWEQLKAENAPLRVCEGAVIKSVGEDYFDECIMEYAPEGEFKESLLVGLVLGRCGQYVKDSFIVKRIDSMIEKGIIKVVKEHNKKIPPYFRIIKKVE